MNILEVKRKYQKGTVLKTQLTERAGAGRHALLVFIVLGDICLVALVGKLYQAKRGAYTGQPHFCKKKPEF
jgi:hypothetical protein